jgi:hypothetical protein
MRKLLLASVAAIGVAAGYGAANAQQADDAGQATVSAWGGAVTGQTQAPGTLVVRLNGRVYTQGGVIAPQNANGTYYYNSGTGTASAVPFFQGTTNAAVGGIQRALPQFFGSAAQLPAGYFASGPNQNVVVIAGQPQTNKITNYNIQSWIRLFPGFDGIAANGLLYGASAEIRQDGNYPAGGGIYGSSSANSATDGRLYVRRAWGYVGTTSLGMVRLGTTDGPSDLFMVGNNENFGDGGWNGNWSNSFPASIVLAWPFADQGGVYANQKIVYLSPVFSGFDFGAAFEPSSTSSIGAATGCNAAGAYQAGAYIAAGPGIAGAGCSMLSSTTTGDYIRRRNTFDLGARYRGLFGPIGFAAYVDYIGSGTVGDNFPTAHAKLDGLSVGSGGAQVTYGGLTIGGMAFGGRQNTGNWAPVAQGAAPGVAYEFGGSYTYGPLIVGANLYQYWYSNGSGPALQSGVPTGISPFLGQERDTGVNVGATYSVAPGLALTLTYLWGEKKQNGRDFLIGNVNAATVRPMTTTQGLGLGALFTW